MKEETDQIIPLEVAKTIQVQRVPVKQSPIEMASQLIEQKVDPAFVEKMLDLQIKFEENEAKKAYFVAFTNFKKNPPKILKDNHVKYENRDGTFTEYDHSSLGNVTDEINKSLSEYDMSMSWKQTQDKGTITVTCRLAHILGHTDSTSLTGPFDTSGGKNPIQGLSSTNSYLERYTALAITGLATHEKDDDGRGSEQPKEKSDDIVISSDQLTDLKDKMKEKNVSEDTILREYNRKNLWTLDFGNYKNAVKIIDEMK